MERERQIEMVLWGLFLILLFTVTFVVANIDSKNSKISTSTNNVVNSYNTNNYYYYSNYDYSYSNDLPIEGDIYLERENYAGLQYNKERDCTDTAPRFNEHYSPSRYSQPISSPFCLDCLTVPTPKYSDPYAYDSTGNHKKEYVFGSYADTFRVLVTNNGNSDYFRVEYTFYDCEGKSSSDQERYYISHGEKKEFYVRDISHDSDAYCSWEYKVIREHD